MLKQWKGNKKSKKKQTSYEPPPVAPPPAYNEAFREEVGAGVGQAIPEPTSPLPRVAFHCQLAHGSPTTVVSTFTSVTELYDKIAASFDISSNEILFCTLNSHKIDMTKLMGGQLALDDFIFAHIKGRPKEVDIEKSDDALGLTITDNGAGCAFVKGIKVGSVAANVEGIAIGDHIEKIDNCSVVGCRHHEVAKMLKAIPKGMTFTLRVIEPLKSGFSEIGGKNSNGKKNAGFGTGKETLRLRSKGPATVETPDEVVSIAVDKINSLLEAFIGISDTELAQTIWELGNTKANPSDFADAIEKSELKEFEFTDSFAFDLWGAISDAKQGRLQQTQNFAENF